MKKETHICIKSYSSSTDVFMIGDEVYLLDIIKTDINYVVFVDLYGEICKIDIDRFDEYFERIENKDYSNI